MEEKDLTQCRQEIDLVDDQIADLFRKRMEIALDVARYKKEHGLPVTNRAREREILARVTEKTGDEFAGYAKVLYNSLFDVSRSYQARYLSDGTPLTEHIRSAVESTPRLFPEKAVVACQGVEGAYSQIVADKMFSLPSIVYFKRFENVFQAVDKGLCEYGLLPIENSSHGSVTEVYDLMKHYRFFIARSFRLRIHHCLLAKPGSSLQDVREVFSHEQAIGQCSEFLKKHPEIKVTVCENTAMAAKLVAESGRKDAAALSSRNCAELYGLRVIDDSVQDSDNNYTRFICISKDMKIFPGANKISLMLSVDHTPGSLYGVLAKFASAGLNLTKLESRPIPGRDFEFIFYFDFDASIYSESVLQLLSDLEGCQPQMVFLGSYSEY